MISGLNHLGDQLESVLEGLDIWCRYGVLVQVVPGFDDTICEIVLTDFCPGLVLEQLLGMPSQYILDVHKSQ